MRTKLLLAALLLVGSTLVLPSTSAHAAPAEAAYETRLLHDHNDDSAVVLLGKHGFDAIALDAREGYNLLTDEPTLILKLILNGGCSDTGQTSCDDLRHVVSFEANGVSSSVTFVTEDGGATWSGDMDRYGSPVDLNDGTRFAIEGEIRMSLLGLAVGDELSNWYVEGYADGEPADNMPAGFDNQRSTLDLTGPIATVYDIGTYTLQAPDYYVALDMDTSPITGDATRNATVTNLLDQPARIELLADAPSGITVDFGEFGQIDLAGGEAREIQFDVSGAGSGEVRILAATALGGIAQASFDVAGTQAGPIRITSPDLERDGTFAYTFERAGVFSYHNHKNPLVEGLVTVLDGNETVQSHEIRYVAADNDNGAAFDPEELTIQVGDTVRWVNDLDALAIMGTLADEVVAHEHSHHDHGDHDHGTDTEADDTEDAPGVPIVLLLVGLLAIALRRR